MPLFIIRHDKYDVLHNPINKNRRKIQKKLNSMHQLSCMLNLNPSSIYLSKGSTATKSENSV